MSDETAIIPVREIQPTIYRTRTARLRYAFYKTKRAAVDFILATVPEGSRREAALEWLDYHTDLVREGFWNNVNDLRQWRLRLRRARAYGKHAKHRRQMFARNTVSEKLKLERHVNANTPAEDRIYSDGTSAGDWTHIMSIVQSREIVPAPAPAPAPAPVSRVHDDIWQPSNAWERDDWRQAIVAEMRNSQLILSGAEGPLLR